MSQKYLHYGIAVLIILATGGLGYYVYRDMSFVANDGATTTQNGVEFSGDATIREENIPTVNISIPDLDRFIVASNIPADERLGYVATMQKLSVALKKDPTLYPYWLDLATTRLHAGDFEGARIIWEYQTVVWSDQFVPFYNLGSLYTSDFHNPAQAEVYYRKALELRPAGLESINTYLAMHDLYIGAYPEKKSLADDILLEGLAENPNNISLLFRLGAYYRDLGDTERARARFEEALVAAQAAGDADAQVKIEAQLAAL